MMESLQPGLDERLIGLGIAIATGMIVGLQREWADNKPLGVRSFALVSALGGLSALLIAVAGGWPVAAGLLALALILAARVRAGEDRGLTTVIAALVVYLLGAAAVAGYWLHVIVLGGVVTVLLHWKQPLHRWVDQLGAGDFEIIARFVLITLVVLPVLPDRTFGPYAVFNPFNTWLLVVLIVTMNLVGYVAFRLIGTRSGSWIGGLLGGLVSSTATTISYAGMSRQSKTLGGVAAIVILVASTVVYGRILVELFVVSPGLISAILWPAIVFSCVLLALSAFIYMKTRTAMDSRLPERQNPARIRQALTFAVLYVAILFAVAAARELVGEDAIYGVAILAGLTDVDALTLSVGQLFASGEAGASIAWRAIFLATLSNLVFKIGAASVLGSQSLRRWILGSGMIALLAGGCIIAWWP